jgi:hypothetical protein
MRRHQLKALVLLVAVIEAGVFCAYVLVGTLPLNTLLASAVLVGALLLSLRYFWQRLSGRPAQFGNLVVAPCEHFDELDGWMLGGHLVFAVGTSLLFAFYARSV